MKVHKHNARFSDRPTVDHDMSELALKHICVIGEAHYRPVGRSGYFKVYIALKNLWHKRQLRNFMKAKFQGADIVCMGKNATVFEIPIDTDKSTIDLVYKTAQETFASWVV